MRDPNWMLEEGVDFLNHGSFGATPRAVFDAQMAWLRRIEGQPVRFFMRDLEAASTHARERLAEFVGADPANLAFVSNATAAVNTALGAASRAIGLAAGDAILVTSHGYAACTNAAKHIAQGVGATVNVARLPIPVTSEDQAVEAILDAVTPTTRIALVDHITSWSALVLPIERIVKALQALGIVVIVDAAHAVGQVPLNLDQVGAEFTTSNCHKWLCTPKGSAFLHVRSDWLARTRPLSISHGAGVDVGINNGAARFRAEFDWPGTDDPSAHLTIPVAIDVLAALAGDWPTLYARNRQLALDARTMLCDALDAAPICPEAMVGSMATVLLPEAPFAQYAVPPAGGMYTMHLQDLLWEQHRIEVPISMPAPGRVAVRVSAQLYNDVSQYERLAAALVGFGG